MKGLVVLLSIIVAPLDAPTGRASGHPEWVTLARESKLPLHAEFVVSDLWATREQARSDALRQAASRARDFAAEVEPQITTAWEVPAWLVRDQLLREPIFVEEVDWTYGPMYRAHLLMDLSPQKRDVLLSEWHELVVRRRLGQIGGTFGFLLVCLATMLAYLRLDDVTRGYYSRWLLAGAAGVVAGSAALLYTWVV